MGRSGGHDLGGGYISPEASLSLHTQISEPEKPGFQYYRMYSEDMIQMTKSIIRQIEITKQTLLALAESQKRSRKSGVAAMLDLSSWFQDDTNIGDFPP
uniref:Uncharacterized protein n=1 Tax=Magallana gigas TaxID=29159 RepID=A0A8W8KE51_MAGGI